MKKLLLILAIIFIPLQANALEDYLILSDKKVEDIFCTNENIVTISPLFTIENKKTELILKAKKQGQAVIIITTEDDEKVINVEITQNKTILSKVDGLKYFELDIPRGINGRNN